MNDFLVVICVTPIAVALWAAAAVVVIGCAREVDRLIRQWKR